MPKRQSHLIVNRRQVLQRLTIVGITVTGGYVLYEYQPWLNYNRQAQDTWKSLKQESVMSAQLHELVRSATLAASGHNTQPWKFAIIVVRFILNPTDLKTVAEYIDYLR
jgi:hypothetical protein